MRTWEDESVFPNTHPIRSASVVYWVHSMIRVVPQILGNDPCTHTWEGTTVFLNTHPVHSAGAVHKVNSMISDPQILANDPLHSTWEGTPAHCPLRRELEHILSIWVPPINMQANTLNYTAVPLPLAVWMG